MLAWDGRAMTRASDRQTLGPAQWRGFVAAFLAVSLLLGAGSMTLRTA